MQIESQNPIAIDSPEKRQQRLEAIRPWLRYGDLEVIKDMVGQYTRNYVGQVLSLNNTRWNESIVVATEQYIRFRKERLQENARQILAQQL